MFWFTDKNNRYPEAGMMGCRQPVFDCLLLTDPALDL